MTIRLGCQTYTWEMSGQYVGKLDHILNVLNKSGFQGVEPETQFLGVLAESSAMKAALEEAGLELAAVCLVEDWLQAKETSAERERADICLSFMQNFPDALLNLCQMPTTRPEGADDLRERQSNLLACVDTISRRFHGAGIAVGYHPNSPDASIFRTAEDYDLLLGELDDAVVGWIPDVGHMARAGLDPLDWIRRHRPLVRHLHYKDMDADGNWREMGDGCIDFHGITSYLVETSFEGWIVVEDECDRAITQPDEVTLDDWTWLKRELAPLLEPSP